MERDGAARLTTEQRAFFSLLRAGLWEREPDDLSPFPLTGAQWQGIYRKAASQTVTGIVFRGLHHLPDEWLPDEMTMMRWMAEADRIERANRRMNLALQRLLELMHSYGLHPVVMKGQGVARFYEHPLLRECGDIDLYFPAETQKKRATALMREMDCRPRQQPDGSDVYLWQGVEIEHHNALFDLCNPFVKDFLRDLAQKNELIDLFPNIKATEKDKLSKIYIPLPLPNLLLLNAHLLKHLMGHGIGLRQFCDIARAYHRLNGCYPPEELKAAHRKTGLYRWSLQLHAFLTEHLGLSRDELPYTDARMHTDPQLMRKVWEGGNFGMNDRARDEVLMPAWKRKLHTLQSFKKQSGFSLRYAPREAFWTMARLMTGNLFRQQEQ